MLKRFRGLFRRSKTPLYPKITVLDAGFAFVSGSICLSVVFDEVLEITAFKRDLLTTDIVCFAIKTYHKGRITVVEINEEMPGFDTLSEKLSSLPGYVSNWRQLVVEPAFKENRTVIFSRPLPEPGTKEEPDLDSGQ